MTSLRHLRPLVATSAVVLLSLSKPVSVLACYCDETPFWRLAASADFVVVGRIVKTERGEATPKAGKTGAPEYWVSTVEVTRVIKGTPPKPFLVGGYGSSCDFAEPVFRSDDVYAFAFRAKAKTSHGFFWFEMCNRGAIGIQGQSEHGETSVEQVIRWVQATPSPSAKRPQNKQMQRTRPAQAMEPRR